MSGDSASAVVGGVDVGAVMGLVLVMVVRDGRDDDVGDGGAGEMLRLGMWSAVEGSGYGRCRLAVGGEGRCGRRQWWCDGDGAAVAMAVRGSSGDVVDESGVGYGLES
ncbi:hypothetical protein F0562_015342 [Nyssa sinensis]|uniref:Uncharacterized protein n=1 Tax=Nyssa sinensis TaxID=561372 RepID=A0A5J4ZIH3_9ASTE|nr:hypothetical protein F0562_015342 [Nyssa sinensis]